jgi:tetratricopeptide (TPR) repeat protein
LLLWLQISLDEIGIQLFAQEKFDEALKAFIESRKILSKWYGSSHPRLCMVNNNIACCTFQMGNGVGALLTMNEAREVQRLRNDNSPAKADLDLLYMAILLNNTGYLLVNTKQYDEARASFEEALLVSLSRCMIFVLKF